MVRVKVQFFLSLVFLQFASTISSPSEGGWQTKNSVPPTLTKILVASRAVSERKKCSPRPDRSRPIQDYCVLNKALGKLPLIKIGVLVGLRKAVDRRR